MNPQVISELAILLSFLPPRREIMVAAMAEDAKRHRDAEIDRMIERQQAVAISLRECPPSVHLLKNTHLPREDWRGQGKRRARPPK